VLAAPCPLKERLRRKGCAQKPGTHADVVQLLEDTRVARQRHWASKHTRADTRTSEPNWLASAFDRLPYWLILTGTLLAASLAFLTLLERGLV
jgi:hypothetical protein